MKKLILTLFIFLLFSCSFYNKEINNWNNNNLKIENQKYLKNNNIKNSEYWYIFKNNELIINENFKLFQKNNIKKLASNVKKLWLFEANNLEIDEIYKILKDLKVKEIEYFRVKCISKNDLSKNLWYIINDYKVKIIMIDNVLCWKNNDFSVNDVKEIFSLNNLEKMIFLVWWKYVDNLEELFKNARIENISVWVCKKKGNYIKIEKQDNKNYCWVN
jgi:hypothetical protein